MQQNISKSEAEQALGDIGNITQRMRQGIAESGASTLLILWGVIWVIGYSFTQFFPEKAGLGWAPLGLGGGLASWFIGSRPTPVRSPGSARIGIFWLVLFGYASIWTLLLHPFNEAHLGAYLGTVPMFAYVVGGLWLGRFFIFLGLIVTGLIILGVFALPAWSNLWSGLAGGGSLVVAGLYIRRNWRQAWAN